VPKLSWAQKHNAHVTTGTTPKQYSGNCTAGYISSMLYILSIILSFIL
jgi:hypothetical protein